MHYLLFEGQRAIEACAENILNVAKQVLSWIFIFFIDI